MCSGREHLTAELTLRREFIQPSPDESKLRNTFPPLASNDLFGVAVGFYRSSLCLATGLGRQTSDS
jgi:hypothetical protein